MENKPSQSAIDKETNNSFVSIDSNTTKKASGIEFRSSALAIPRQLEHDYHRIFTTFDWRLAPTFSDFEAIEKDTNSTFPYKYVIFGGNHSDLVAKILRPRGFTRAAWSEDDPVDNVDFIWRPFNFSPRVVL